MRTSLARAPASLLLPCVRDRARRLGVTRCSAITLLDVLEIPVWTAIRPNAHPESICVHAGKGPSDDEAELGALFEAIEFAVAESYAPEGETMSLRALFDDVRRPCDHIDLLSPRLDVAVHAERQLRLVEAEQWGTSERGLVPLQLAAHRHTDAPDIFGTSTNGLAASARRDESILHGLLEVIERDIASFELVRRRGRWIDTASLPSELLGLLQRWRRHGLHCVLESAPNEIDVAYVRATIVEIEANDPAFICTGYGCHLDGEIALWRAITEAAQSRLSLIHGARDDLVERDTLLAALNPTERTEYARRLLQVTEPEPFTARSWDGDATAAIDDLVTRMTRAGLPRPWVVDLVGEPDFSVVRVVAPGLEMFETKHGRIGPRLAAHATGST